MTVAAFLALAGAGAVLRALAGRQWNRHEGFAAGTLVVNVIGSFILGLLHAASPHIATVVGVGFLGALTTYSSFVRDAIALVELRRFMLSALYFLLTLVACVAAAAMGVQLS